MMRPLSPKKLRLWLNPMPAQPTFFLLLFSCSLHAPSAVAQIAVDRLFPPMAAIGSTITLTAEGKLSHWPIRIHCDRPGLVIEAGDKQGQLVVTVPPGESPGVAWLRLFDDASASNLVPLLIEPGPVLLEQEPNGALSESMAIELPRTVVGRLEKNGDVDSYRISIKAGQLFVASVIAHDVLRSPMDAVLQLVDSRGNILAQSDDERGLDPQIIYASNVDQELVIRIFAFPETPTSTIGFAGAASFVYAIRLATDSFVDHTLPFLVPRDQNQPDMFRAFGWNLSDDLCVQLQSASDVSPPIAYVRDTGAWQWMLEDDRSFDSHFESNSSVAISAPSVPFIFSGHILQPREVDSIVFSVEQGHTYRAEVYSRKLGFLLDSVLRAIDVRTGKELAQADDLSRRDYDAVLDLKAKDSGPVELQITDLADSGSLRHAYTVLLYEPALSFSLTLATDQFTLQPGKTQEIPISVDRQLAMDRKLVVLARDLPQGVTCDQVFSEAKGATAKSVTLKLIAANDAQPFQGPFRIDSQIVDSNGAPVEDSTRACTFELRPRVHSRQFWLTLAKPR